MEVGTWGLMKTSKLKFIFAILFASVLLGFFQSCESTTGSGGEKDSIEAPPVLEGTSTGNPFINIVIDDYTVENGDPLPPVSLCISKIRFEKTIPRSTETEFLTFDFALGLLQLTQIGAYLGELEIPVGYYVGVELILEDICSSYSISFENDFGTQQTNKSLSMKFIGLLRVRENGSTLDLDIMPIMLGLEEVNYRKPISSVLKNTFGKF